MGLVECDQPKQGSSNRTFGAILRKDGKGRFISVLDRTLSGPPASAVPRRQQSYPRAPFLSAKLYDALLLRKRREVFELSDARQLIDTSVLFRELNSDMRAERPYLTRTSRNVQNVYEALKGICTLHCTKRGEREVDWRWGERASGRRPTTCGTSGPG